MKIVLVLDMITKMSVIATRIGLSSRHTTVTTFTRLLKVLFTSAFSIARYGGMVEVGTA